MPDSTRNVVMIVLSDEDIKKVRNKEFVTVDNRKIAITKRHNKEFNPDAFRFVIGMSEKALERVENHEVVNYGMNNTGEINEEVVIRNGEISGKLGTEMSSRDRVIDSGMTPEEADRYK